MKNIIYQKKEEVNNRNKFFKFISSAREFKKQEVADDLKVSFPTATKFTDEFIELGIINSVGYDENNAKKKALIYSYNPNSYFSIGIKLEVNRVSFIIINLDGEIIKKNEIQRDFFNKKDITEYICFQLELFLNDFREKDKIKGIGISLPGIVDSKNQIFQIGTNFKIFSENFHEIEEKIGLPICLINEANAGVVGEYILGNFKNDNIAFVSIDTGIGCGIIINGNLYLGNRAKAGEFGHFTVENNGRECTCGNKGCLERYCSTPDIIKEFEEKFNQTNLEIYDIFAKNLHKTEKGKEIFKKYFDYLGNGLRSLQFLFDFDKIIIGGEIVNFYEELNYKEALNKIIYNNIFFENEDFIQLSKQIDSSNILGAAFLSFKEFYLDIFDKNL